MNAVKRSLYSLHIAVMLLGFTALFSKVIPLSATDITFGRSIVASITLIVLVKLTKGSLKLYSARDYLIALILGVLMATHWVTYFAAMQYSSVSVGMIALFTFPVITVFLEPFFEGTRLVYQDIVSAVVVFLGIFLILPDTELNNDVTLGIGIGIFSAVLYALRNLVHRKYFNHYSGAHAMAYQTLVIAAVLVWFISPNLVDASSKTLWLIVILGTFCTAAPHALVAASLQHLRAKTFSLVACMQPLYGVILAMIVIDESPTWQTLVGGALVISAAVYETINAHKLHSKSHD
ncbi:EamA family transporter [Neptunicella marina]|uniref:DMT family transporter n=1 Tax=Neptunicella marina TaxID=2125989 RepID=A0A8J6M095_9ALTE|nr:DMT family transporter [Neptunicella marina]